VTSPTLWPEVESLLVAYLETLVADADQVNTETPDDFAGLVPFIRVYRFGGNTNRTNDFADVQLDVFHPLRSVGLPLARQIPSQLLGPPPPVAMFDRIECSVGPREMPWGDDDTMRRWGATYRVVSRRRATT
jgi:hypothetical protein